MKLHFNQFENFTSRHIFRTPDGAETDIAGPDGRDISDDPEALVKQYKDSLQSESPEEIKAATAAIDKYIEGRAAQLVEKGWASLVRAEIREAADPSLDDVIDKVEARYEASDGGVLNVNELKSMVTIYTTPEERGFLEERAKEILEPDDLKAFNEYLAEIDKKLEATSYVENKDSFEGAFRRQPDQKETVNPATLLQDGAVAEIRAKDDMAERPIVTEDLSDYVTQNLPEGKDRAEFVRELTRKALEAGVDQVNFAGGEDGEFKEADQAAMKAELEAYMKELTEKAEAGDEEAKTELEARKKRLEVLAASDESQLTDEAKAWVQDIVTKEEAAAKEGRSLEGFGASELAEADIPSEWKESEAAVADKEAILKLAEGLDAEAQAAIKELLESGEEADLEKARILAWAEQGEKLLQGKRGEEVLDIVEQNPDAAFNHFFKAEEGQENTWKVDFQGIDERLLGAGHFEKNLMAKFQYVKIFNPKTGQTNIGVRGVKPGSEKPGYFDIHTGQYLPIWSGSVIKGLTAKDISELDVSTRNAMQGENGKPMSIKDYMAQAKEKRQSYRTSVENGTAEHQIGGENPLNVKLSEEAGREVVAEKQAKLRNAVGRLMRDKSRYESVAQKHNVPWELLAAIQYREASGNLNKYFLNGQDVGTTTTIVPKGLRFSTWEASAEHAIVERDHYGFKRLGTNPSPHSVANLAERYNGMGYSKRGLVSPYVWAGHPAYEQQGGMFVSDGNFSRSAHDNRLGVMPIYMELLRQQGKGGSTPNVA